MAKQLLAFKVAWWWSKIKNLRCSLGLVSNLSCNLGFLKLLLSNFQHWELFDKFLKMRIIFELEFKFKMATKTTLGTKSYSMSAKKWKTKKLNMKLGLEWPWPNNFRHWQLFEEWKQMEKKNIWAWSWV
jgi:hypothetical protein